MNRLEYLAHNGDPEEIINEVMQEIAAWKRLIDTSESINVALTERIKKLTRAVEILYHGSPELQQVAENAFSGCASTQRDNAYELKEYLEGKS